MESLKQKIKQKKRGFTWSGFSLVELLIAAGISLVILMVIGLVYISSERSFRFGQAALDTEANLRLAMDWLTRDIREAEKLQGTKDLVNGKNVILLNSSGDTVSLTVASGPTVYTVKSNNDRLELKRTGVNPHTDNKTIINMATSSPNQMSTDIIISSDTVSISGKTTTISYPSVQVALSSTKAYLGRQHQRTLTSKITMRNAE